MPDDTTAAATASAPTTPVRFDTKIAVVLRDDLLPWQELNVTSFLISGITASTAGLTGEPYRDRDGNAYLPLLRQPVVVLSASAEQLATAHHRALSRGLDIGVYIGGMFTTDHDEANRAAVAAVAAADLDLVGIALRAPRNVVDRVVKGARMHA